MQLDLDQAALTTAVQDTMLAAVKRSLDGWEVQQALGKALSHEVAEGVVAEALRYALARMDLQRLSVALATELERAATVAVVAILQEGFIDCILRLRGVATYDDRARDTARKAVWAELFGKGEDT